MSKIHPKPRFELPNGFTIFESCFKNPDGSRGMVAGPHRYITEILKSLNQSHMSLGAYLTDMARAFRTAPLSDTVAPKFSPRSCRVYSNLALRSKMLPTALRDSQFFRRVYAVVARWRYLSSASMLCKLFPIVIESRQAKRVAV